MLARRNGLRAVRCNAGTIQGLRCSTERVLLMQPRSVGAQSPVWHLHFHFHRGYFAGGGGSWSKLCTLTYKFLYI